VEPILRGDADLMLGSRFLGDPRAGGMPTWKYISNRFLTALENFAFGLRSDTARTAGSIMKPTAIVISSVGSVWLPTVTTCPAPPTADAHE